MFFLCSDTIYGKVFFFVAVVVVVVHVQNYVADRSFDLIKNCAFDYNYIIKETFDKL